MPGFPNRCQHIKINGTQCGSPALRRNRFCYFHKRFQDESIKLSADRARHGVATFILPVLEDANSIQIALMQVIRLLVTQRIEHKTASLLLYALQTASSNIRHAEFKPHRNDVILDLRAAGENPLDAYHLWDDRDFDEEVSEEEETRLERAEELERVRLERKKKAALRAWAEKEFDRLQAEGRVERAREDAEIARREAHIDKVNAEVEARAEAQRKAEADKRARDFEERKRQTLAQYFNEDAPKATPAASNDPVNATAPAANVPKKPSTVDPEIQKLRDQIKQGAREVLHSHTYPQKKEAPKSAS